MAISVNHQQNKNDQPDGEENDNERFVSPNIAHEIGEIGIHLRSIFGQFTGIMHLTNFMFLVDWGHENEASAERHHPDSTV